MRKYWCFFDENGRITVPAEFREKMEKELVLHWGKDRLFVYSKKQWKKLEEKLKKSISKKPEKSRILRIFYSLSFETSIDAKGRILFPKILRKLAHLEQKEVLVEIVDDYLRISK